MGWTQNFLTTLAILIVFESFGINYLFHYVPGVTYLKNKVYLGPSPPSDSFIDTICQIPPSDSFIDTTCQTPPPPPTNFSLNDLKGRPLFVFGDSTVDAGNFNITKYPYGAATYHDRKTTRFTDGYTIADYLALKMKTPFPRAFNTLGVDELKKNVNINFACGGCGLLSTTHPLQCTTFADQVIQFQTSTTKNEDLGRSVFFISVGANDFVFSFDGKLEIEKGLTEYTAYKGHTPGGKEKRLESYLKVLYSCGGARIFIVNNIGPVGCIPDKRDRTTNQCDEVLNTSIRVYNNLLVQTLRNFKKEHDVVIFLADSDAMFSKIMNAPSSFGFTEIYKPCCGVWEASFRMFRCNETTPCCKHPRTEFLFFDGAHTTHEANRIFVEHCLTGEVCSPIHGHGV